MCIISLLPRMNLQKVYLFIFSDFLGIEGKLKFVIPPISISLKPGAVLFFSTYTSPAFYKFYADCSRIASVACTNALG